MNQNSNQHTACKKVEILREHLENQVPISEIARRYGINPNLIHKWKKQLFDGKMEQRLEERQKKLDQAADPPAPDIGGRSGNRKNLSLFEKGRKFHFLMNRDIGSYRIVRSYR